MIETTLATKFVPGTNLQGDLVSADWRFLLPGQQMERILCLGVPSSSSVAVLATLGKEVFVASSNGIDLDNLQDACQKAGVENFHFVPLDDLEMLPFGAAAFSLIYVAQRAARRRFLTSKTLQVALARLLEPRGVVHFEVRNYVERRRLKAALRNLQAEGLAPAGVYWLTPFKGEMRTALPVSDAGIASFFFENVIFGQSFKKRMLSAIGSGLSRADWIGKVTPRHAVFLQKTAAETGVSAAPEFLVSLAQKSGCDFSQVRCGLSTRGKFNANKVIYYLFETGDTQPGVIVKMTRAPAFNFRLENEFKTLHALEAGRFVPNESFPHALFFDTHNGLALLAQKAVLGQPFRSRTTATPDCPVARNALDWLHELGQTSKNSDLVTGKEVGNNLDTLYQRFKMIYRLSADERAFMEKQIASMQDDETEFPLVFQHGDPGTWNILVSDDDRVIFIDWEAGEPRGIPLWDLFYFMRTFASWVARQQGSTHAIQNFSSSFLSDSPFSQMLAESVASYCAKIGLAAAWIEPLFYTCWMHRALKESTRLKQTSVDQGHYVNLLKCCIAKREVTPLQQLFSPGNAEGRGPGAEGRGPGAESQARRAKIKEQRANS
ncbi:MAG: phosphotransferase, partial [bacterium]